MSSTSSRPAKLMLVALLGATMTLGACKHYRVTDLSNGTNYYTKRIDHKTGGAVTFRDARTDTKVTLQNTDVDAITRSEFKQATRDASDTNMNNQ